jgi:branched-chain amino acid transport system permease protein
MSPLVSRSNNASKIAGVIALLVAAGLCATPFWGTVATQRVVGEFMIYLALASLWNLLAGYTGLVSVGQQAFVGIGAYILISLALLAGWNPLYAVPIAGLASALIAIPVGALVFRLQGAYFAIGTWVMAEAIRLFVAQITVLGGGSGISLPTEIMKMVGATKFWREATIYWLALALGLGTLALVYVLLRSKLGLALTAIRDNELASESLGVRIERIKFSVYVFVAGMTGMIGGLIVLQKVRMSPDAAFSVNDWTAFVIFIVVIGGIGTIEGPIIGTILYFVLREFLADLGSIYLMILGALAIAMMLLAPKGIWGVVKERLGTTLFPTSYHVDLMDEKPSK